jgi:hypothetical protein
MLLAFMVELSYCVLSVEHRALRISSVGRIDSLCKESRILRERGLPQRSVKKLGCEPGDSTIVGEFQHPLYSHCGEFAIFMQT